MWVSEEGRVQGHAYAICVIKDIIHLHRGFFCCQINSRGTHICLLSSCPIFKYFEYPIPNSYLPLASIHFFIYYISAVLCMHAKQYMYAIIITSGAHALIFSGLFQSYVLKRSINLHLRRVFFPYVKWLYLGKKCPGCPSCLWHHTLASESHESRAYWTLHASAAQKQQRHALIQDILQQSRNGDSPVCLFLFCSIPSPTSVHWFKEGSPSLRVHSWIRTPFLPITQKGRER